MKSPTPMLEIIEAKRELSVGDVAWLIARVRNLEDAVDAFVDEHGGLIVEPLRVALEHRRFAPYAEES